MTTNKGLITDCVILTH